ncbi:cupin domain-containing protein [Williamsia sp. MIQD14]|uniref:cupin domain-containing protein n=1 Tax=Williamsia sp. MIQD14 TaxID=3425703 RepID=UPI003DA185BE
MITFEDLVGDETRFHEEYFGRRTLLRRGAVDDPTALLSARDLDDLLSLESIRPPYIKVNLNGSGVPEKGYTRSVVVQGVNVTDTVVADKVYELFKAGATVTWCSLNHILPTMRRLADVVNDKLSVRTDPVAFLTPAGRKGYPPHHDPVDLFIVQLSGTKRWKLWDLPEPRKGDNESYTLEKLGAPSDEFVMAPGDVLYLPYGTPHAAAAEDETSLHLSVMMRPRMWSELILDLVKDIVASDNRYNVYPSLARSKSGEMLAQLTELTTHLTEALTDRISTSELDRLRALPASQGGHGRRSTFESVVAADALHTAQSLVRTGVGITVLDVIDGRATVSVNGSRIAMPSSVAELLSAVEPGATVPLDDIILPSDDSGRRLAMVKALARLDLVRGTV